MGENAMSMMGIRLITSLRANKRQEHSVRFQASVRLLTHGGSEGLSSSVFIGVHRRLIFLFYHADERRSRFFSLDVRVLSY
jgi:hypothetical protein